MNREQLMLAAKRKIDARRQKALDDCDKTLSFLRAHDDWKNCERALKSAQVQVVFYKDTSAKATVEKQKQIRAELLKKYGVSETDLLPKYSCKKCEDTGYANGRPCSCLQTVLRTLLVAESNVADKSFTFENSTETNKHNLSVYKMAQKVCEQNALQNILLTGGTGTGKTYLLSCCMDKCAQLGKSVLFVTAYNLNSLFLESHLSDLATNRIIMDNLTDVDVLAIDDLGTEKVYKNVTAEYTFQLLNERIARRKQTFISTNLSLADIRERYDERLFSRMLDQNLTLVAKLEGSDKRIKK